MPLAPALHSFDIIFLSCQTHFREDDDKKYVGMCIYEEETCFGHFK